MIFRHVEFLSLKSPVDGDHRKPVTLPRATKDRVVLIRLFILVPILRR
jgi:hypothetical protein